MLKIKVDDKVIVKKPDYWDKEEQVEWVLSMDDYENSSLTVSNMDFSCSDIFQVRGTHWWFHTNWITHVNGVPINKETSSKSKPSKQERPYENWKMSISRNKFARCINDKRVLRHVYVEGLLGYLNKDECVFYYRLSVNKYIAAEVYPFKYPDDTEGWEFVKENCDSLQKSIVPEVNDSLVSRAAKKSDILESTKNGILASFDVPKKMLGNDTSECTLTYNPVKTITKTKYKRCAGSAIGKVCYFNQYGKLILMFKSACEKYYYWFAANSKGEVIYYRGDIDWVVSNYTDKEKFKAIQMKTDPSIYDFKYLGAEPIKSDGGKSDYYKITLPNWVVDKQQENGYIMLEDLAEVIFDNDFNFTNVFKAQKRMFELKKGRGKAGNDFEYDAKKCHYYIDKQIEVEGRK